MKKFFIKCIVSLILVLTLVNTLSIYINGGTYRITTVLSPFHFREKVVDGAQFSLQLTQHTAFRLQQKLP